MNAKQSGLRLGPLIDLVPVHPHVAAEDVQDDVTLIVRRTE
jgi:hypothetical protein